MTTTLQVLIATCGGDGIIRVCNMDLPTVPGVEYLVMWQKHGDAPVPSELVSRKDVMVLRSERIGLSANRNDLLAAATAPLVLIADDDLRYTAKSLQEVMAVTEANPDVDYFSFRYSGPDAKFYPDHECSLCKPIRNFYQTSFEVAMRRNERTAELRYREDFGIGAPYFGSGEEEMLLMSARRHGVNCRFFPITIVTHPGLSTGLRKPTAVTLHSRAAIVALRNKWTWPLRILLLSWRLRSVSALGPLVSAACKVARHRRRYEE